MGGRLAEEALEDELEAGATPNRLSEAKMSYSSEDGSNLLLPAFLLESLLDSGSVSTRGLGVASGGDADGTEAEDFVEVSGVGLLFAWLFLSDEGTAELARLELRFKTSLLSLRCSSGPDLWAACCLAALDGGLRCAATLARVCRREVLLLITTEEIVAVENHLGDCVCVWGGGVDGRGDQSESKANLVSALQGRNLSRRVKAHTLPSVRLSCHRSCNGAGDRHLEGGAVLRAGRNTSGCWQSGGGAGKQGSRVDHQIGLNSTDKDVDEHNRITSNAK